MKYLIYPFRPDNTYTKGQIIRVNIFWDITDGAKAGGELILGNRENKNDEIGNTARFNVLFYYDF